MKEVKFNLEETNLSTKMNYEIYCSVFTNTYGRCFYQNHKEYNVRNETIYHNRFSSLVHNFTTVDESNFTETPNVALND